jgi:hypothetical protein
LPARARSIGAVSWAVDSRAHGARDAQSRPDRGARPIARKPTGRHRQGGAAALSGYRHPIGFCVRPSASCGSEPRSDLERWLRLRPTSSWLPSRYEPVRHRPPGGSRHRGFRLHRERAVAGGAEVITDGINGARRSSTRSTRGPSSAALERFASPEAAPGDADGGGAWPRAEPYTYATLVQGIRERAMSALRTRKGRFFLEELAPGRTHFSSAPRARVLLDSVTGTCTVRSSLRHPSPAASTQAEQSAEGRSAPSQRSRLSPVGRRDEYSGGDRAAATSPPVPRGGASDRGAGRSWHATLVSQLMDEGAYLDGLYACTQYPASDRRWEPPLPVGVANLAQAPYPVCCFYRAASRAGIMRPPRARPSWGSR